MSAGSDQALLLQENQALLEEALDAEVVVDINKLREVARRGMPKGYRGTLYKYFLAVTSLDKSGEMTSSQGQEVGLNTLLSAVSLSTTSSKIQTSALLAASNKAFSQQLATDPARRQRFLPVIDALRVTHTFADEELLKACVSIAAVFDTVFQDSPTYSQDVYYCVEAIMNIFPALSKDTLREECSLFLTLLRTINSELYHHFFHERVCSLQWLPTMIISLLSRQLQLDDLLRLWDHYLSEALPERGIPLHMYVCLALLDLFSERLMEMDRVEIIGFMDEIPRVNVDAVIKEARRIRERVRSKGLVE